jgi:ABC-type transporter Mla MlaB component
MAYCTLGAMTSADFAFAVRSGEHACCRSGDPRDRERLLAAFVHAGLRRGHKVVHLCDGCEHDELLTRLCADGAVDAALAGGHLVIREAAGRYDPAGDFDADGMVEELRAEHHLALAEGYTGLSICGDVGAGVGGVTGERLVDYEHRLDTMLDGGTRVLLCQYDHPSFDEHTMSEATAAHQVVVSPALAAIGRTGVLAAARVTPSDTLRMAGELDFEAAAGLAGVLASEFPGPRRVDVADLDFIDVAGLRALRGPEDEPLMISAASEAVRRLVTLLGWDTDPDVEVVA